MTDKEHSGMNTGYLLDNGWRTIGDNKWLPPGIPNNAEPVSTEGAFEIQLYAEEKKHHELS